MCVSVYNVSMCVFVLEAVIVLLLCLVYIAVDCLCLCLRLCVCVCSCVHVYASVCFSVYVCASVVRVCVCLPDWRLLRWAEDALRHPLAPLQLLQITIYQPITFIFIFLRFLLFHCFCDFFVFVFVMLANFALVCCLSLSKRLCQCATCWQARWADTSTSSCCCTLSYSSSTW